MYKVHKIILINLMLLSLVPILLAVDPVIDLATPESQLYLLARMWGLIGTMIMWWQFMLGIRDLVTKFIPDLVWVNNLHKFMGRYGFIAILLHPTFIFLHYAGIGVNILIPKLENDFDFYRLMGTLGFAILAFVWLTSAILRSRIKFRPWKQIHLFIYASLALILFHGLNIGLTLNTNSNLRSYWLFLTGAFVFAVIYRFLQASGSIKKHYVLKSKVDLTHDVTQFTFQPNQKGLVPRPGQFIYLQVKRFGETHPFTVSHFDPRTGEIKLSIKGSGPFSKSLKDLPLGKTVYIQGAYGAFTEEAYTSEKKLVFIAGGIGITPFFRCIADLPQAPKILFWGNKTEGDVCLEEELKRAPNLQIVHVLSNQPTYSGEKGYISIELLKKYLGDDLERYDFFVCGPPVMMDLTVGILKQAGVPIQQIYSEKFSL